MCRELPAPLKDADAEALVRDVLSDLLEFGTSDRIAGSLDELLSTVACSPTSKTNRNLPPCSPMKLFTPRPAMGLLK